MVYVGRAPEERTITLDSFADFINLQSLAILAPTNSKTVWSLELSPRLSSELANVSLNVFDLVWLHLELFEHPKQV